MAATFGTASFPGPCHAITEAAAITRVATERSTPRRKPEGAGRGASAGSLPKRLPAAKNASSNGLKEGAFDSLADVMGSRPWICNGSLRRAKNRAPAASVSRFHAHSGTVGPARALP
jgi:hypothetical protein